jgi:hypothetical protein
MWRPVYSKHSSTNIMSSKPIYHPTNYRKNFITYWRQWHPQFIIPKGYVIHHKHPQSLCKQEGWTLEDTNHPRNLIALHPDDHVTIHRCRGDKISDTFINVCGDRTGSKHHLYSGEYITPWGSFEVIRDAIDEAPFNISRVMLNRLCKEVYYITKRVVARAPSFKQYIGQTSADIGFGFTGEVGIHEYVARRGHSKCEYITPWGTFSSSKRASALCPVSISATSLRSWCTTNKKVTKYTLSKSVYFTIDDLDKTFEELGFSFIK